jgi:N-acetylglucosamine-6-phosphate deacetylase
MVIIFSQPPAAPDAAPDAAPALRHARWLLPGFVDLHVHGGGPAPTAAMRPAATRSQPGVSTPSGVTTWSAVTV